MLSLIILGGWASWFLLVADHQPAAAGTPHKVHIAFGFHVNLYHSFRGDTNDENGFGQDIRVIRHIIAELDRANRRGIPVRADWDFDNRFSLETRLPRYAPDIIRNIQRRVRQDSDEVMPMSYNNGLMSAMTDEEFMASMRRAISNKKGSGVRDLFGRMAPVVRPQEMMTTPGDFARYRQLGIAAVALYYSATPFDAFRLFSRVLTPTEAHNPVNYVDPQSGEQMEILPTYHPGDLVEHVSLRNWAQELHRQQAEGTIDRDVLIFINFDADSEFWTGGDLPAYLKWLPNTGGLSQLIESVADLDFVTFSRVGDYLAGHSPAGTVQFGQDTADGSFNGYQSWAEKATTSAYWTRIERNRRVHRVAHKVFGMDGETAPPPDVAQLLNASFDTRLEALSTTNFGLASPFLSPPRETAMDSLMQRLDGYSDRIEARIAEKARSLLARTAIGAAVPAGAQRIETFVYTGTDAGGDRRLTFTVPADTPDAGGYLIVDGDGRLIPARQEQRQTAAGDGRQTLILRVAARQPMPDGVYALYRRPTPPSPTTGAGGSIYADPRVLRNEFIAVHFDESGHVQRVTARGIPQLTAGSLTPSIIYRGVRLAPQRLAVSVEDDGRDGVAAVRIHGDWPGPAGVTRAPGRVDYRLRLLRGVPYLFVEGTVRYPDTRRQKTVQDDRPLLARKIDDGWQAVAPVELRFAARASRTAPFVVHKRNYLGRDGAYALDYYRFADKNLSLADINNHVTPAYAAVTNGVSGLAVAMDTAVNANFAFCPFALDYHPQTDRFAVRANPFGTYFGRQPLPPTRGTGLGYEAVVLSAPQLHSAGPTYNGYRERFSLMIAFFNGAMLPQRLKADLLAFARPPRIIDGHGQRPWEVTASPVLPPAGFLALATGGGMRFSWAPVGGPETRYRIRCQSLRGRTTRTFTTRGRTLLVGRAELPAADGPYTATIRALSGDGRTTAASPAIRCPTTPEKAGRPDIPNDFKVKVLWANLSAWVQRNLL